MKEGMKKGNKPGEGTKPGQGEKGKSKGDGKTGNGDTPNGESGDDGEGNAGEIMKIYQEQKQLREALENALNKEGLGGNGQNAMEQMKQIEKQLLNKGFNNETLQKILNLQYELLKLEKAAQQQGEEKKRQSQTNLKQFNNQSKPLPANLQEYFNSIEILNRQTLPLRSNFNQKVQEYFKNND
jgi:DNA-binding ferritin-like protein (Dps family)